MQNGEEAIAAAKNNQFTLVILDINLGGENRMELLDLFQRDYPEIPVIMFTQLGFDKILLKEALSKGACAYMSKTESLENLLKEVRRWTPKN